jgi:hypothetical protein
MTNKTHHARVHTHTIPHLLAVHSCAWSHAQGRGGKEEEASRREPGMSSVGPGSFDQGYREHLLENVYGIQQSPGVDQSPSPSLGPLPPSTSKTVETPAWRKRVGENFVKRRQTPASKVLSEKRLQQKTAAITAIKFPPLQGVATGASQDEGGVGLVPRPPQQDREDGERPRSARIGGISGTGATAPTLKYAIDPPGPETLYKIAPSELESLPLEMFDNEDDKSPEEWLQLKGEDDDEPGVAARSVYYVNNQWEW